MSKPVLADLTAIESRTLLDARAMTATELLDAVVARHRATHAAINAIVATDLDTAYRAAAEADARLARGERLSPVDGIPVTVKDNIGVRGMVASWGSRLFADRLCDRDDIAVERLRSAGAVIWCKTNTPEFALAGTTENSLFGITRNPRDTRLTPGGSSGGAAAALAAGVGPLALATDAGGSARRPAAFTGTVGFRPSTGRIPRGAYFPNTTHDLQTLAPMARTVGDARLLYQALVGPDRWDRTSLAQPSTRRDFGSPLRINMFRFVSDKIVDRDILAALEGAASRLRDRGCDVREVAPPFDLARIERIWSVLISTFATAFVREHDRWDGFSGTIQGLAKAGALMTAVDYRAALEDIQRIRREVDELFVGVDAFLCPTSPCFPWPADAPFPGEIDGTPASLRDTAIFLPFANVAGVPAISVPVPGPALPIGLQLIGNFGDDEHLLDIAALLERSFGTTSE
ncbi:aspartyl-tRNA(Asn)/glutamyl-tRNA(Gln) amidotransferase subunit A [Bradyrhizobium sp. USDA 4501]